MVRNFWLREFAGFNDKYRSEAIAPVLNKIGQFFSTDLIRNILGQVKSTIDVRDIMDKKKILIVNLSKGRLGEDNSALLGSLLVTKIQLAAMSRVDIPEEERNDFHLYVDEFQNFTTDSFATILSEARKYRLSLILAHQYIAQLTETGNEKIKNAIFGNVGTTISFRIGAEDALRLKSEFEPVFTTQQLINLDKTQIALKLSIHGKATHPFLANTLAPIFEEDGGRLSIVRDISRERYSMKKEVIKDKINRWLSDDTTGPVSKSKRKRKKKNSTYLKPLSTTSDDGDDNNDNYTDKEQIPVAQPMTKLQALKRSGPLQQSNPLQSHQQKLNSLKLSSELKQIDQRATGIAKPQHSGFSFNHSLDNKPSSFDIPTSDF
jgi:hypothetical protein